MFDYGDESRAPLTLRERHEGTLASTRGPWGELEFMPKVADGSRLPAGSGVPRSARVGSPTTDLYAEAEDFLS